MEKILLGTSSCLLGNKVRYNGQHKYDHFLAATPGEFAEYAPVSPEAECGLPVPEGYAPCWYFGESEASDNQGKGWP